MKAILTSVCLVFIMSSFQNNAVETITLDKALALGIVKISATGTGDYSGHTVNLHLESSFLEPRRVIIEAGSVFRAEDPTVQDQLIPDEITLNVMGRSSETYPIKGYCCERQNSAPDESTTFKFEKMDRPDLLKLCELTNRKNFDDNTLQYAVWAVSDNYDVSTIYSETDPRVKTLRTAICELTNQPDTWYNKKENLVVEEDRTIRSDAESLASDLKIHMAQGQRAFSYKVFNEAGDSTSARKSTLTVPAEGDYTFKFTLKVMGWAKGTYTVDMYMDERKIHTYNFDV
jgi:hypothetical protein